MGAPDYDDDADTNYYTLGAHGSITLEFDINIVDGEGMDIYVFEIGPDVEPTKIEVSSDLKTWLDVGTAEGSLSGIDLKGKIPANGRYKYVRVTDISGTGSGWPGADIDAVAGLNAKVVDSDPWAEDYVLDAEDYGILPDCLKDADLTQRITRAEFAALSVKLYESLTGKPVESGENFFTDTDDAEVVKAYTVGITNGKGGSKENGDLKFMPALDVTRQEAATMLTRTYKAATMAGWTLDTDGSFQLTYTMPSKFKDDKAIAVWAYDSVYFMAANKIIEGSGGLFRPEALPSGADSVNYGLATRQEAIKIAVVTYENLG